MDRKRKSLVTKGKGKLAMPPTRKSPRFLGLPPSLPPTSPKFVLGPNKLLVLAIAAARVETHPKAQENVQRIIDRGGPSRPKPKKVEVINLVSDDEEAKDVEVAVEQPPLVVNQAELEDEEEDPDYEEEEEEDPEESVEHEETPSSYSLLSPFPATPVLASGEYDDPNNWNYDEDLGQWGTDVAGGEPTAAQD
ncbi:hypothetical protein PIB30_085096 [Stylosanthes scabra]|uniref:Uncharacterized protein n=1 Tax=Stylosanthes scabra TaxID=79078 RepID=A0ABU6RSY1_9FABA|nr:hypothetical protein [Stylosanthes scabra]